MADSTRYWKHDFPDTEPEGYAEPLQTFCEKMVNHIENFRWEDASIYTGVLGAVVALIHTSQKEDWGLSWAKKCKQQFHKKRVSFLEGSSGPLALCAVLYGRKQDEEKCKQHLQQLLDLSHQVSAMTSVECEMLYGRCGYLYSVLYVRKLLGDDSIGETVVQKLIQQIMSAGANAYKSPYGLPLHFQWHEKPYVGAAHGYAGILYILFQFWGTLSSEQQALVLGTTDALRQLQFPSGNMPSNLERPRDRLVHWCHGAPGWITTFLKAHEISGDDNYMKAAVAAGNCVWKRGLLKTKGSGLCHGIPGNGYGFLSLYRATKEEVWLNRARRFAMVAIKREQQLNSKYSDDPNALFTGCLAVMVFAHDCLHPDQSYFPGWELPP